MSLTKKPPAGIAVERAQNALNISISATNVLGGRPLNRGEEILKYTLLCGAFMLPNFVGIAIDRRDPQVAAICMGLAVTMFVLLFWKLPSSRPIRHPSATVTLTSHTFTVELEGLREELFLDRIDVITVDAANAWIRVDGRIQYLLCELSQPHRAWLGKVLLQAIRHAVSSTESPNKSPT